MTEQIVTRTYEGMYRVDNHFLHGLPDPSDHKDFTFIRIKMPTKAFFLFPKHVNCIPTEMPAGFQLPSPKFKFKNQEESFRIFKISLEGIVSEKALIPPAYDSLKSFFQFSYRSIRVTKVISLVEIS